MSQTDSNDKNDEMRSEYDFSKGVRGKYFQQYSEGTNVVLLDPDVAEVFKDSESVNQILRSFISVAKNGVPTSNTK